MAILSIQSHVVYGCAGNSSAVFPMQRLGREVWAINTVEFSNHTGYGAWRGKPLGADIVNELVTGLEERGVLGRCEAVLSGYLGDSSVSLAILEAVKKVKKANPAALYFCDPVMGDTGRGVYVKPDIPEIIKQNLIPSADIISPNQFELELLTGIKIDSEETALKAACALSDMGPSVILLTSFIEKEGEIGMIAYSAKDKTAYKATTPKLPVGDNVAGTGDLTAAVFLARYLEAKNLEIALNLCASSVYGILDKSREICHNDIKGGSVGVELKTTAAQEELCSPKNSFKAVKIK